MIKINMGCGWRNFGKDWVHIDGGKYEHLDSSNIFKLPYRNNEVDTIYASHIIEYFDRDEVKLLLTEWIRVLRIGGILRLAVPDFGKIAKLYVENGICLDSFLGPLYGKMSMGNNTIFHKTCYDFHSLRSMLDNFGMLDIRIYDWRETEHSCFDDHSQSYIPHMDKENGILISLNVECKK